MPHDSWTTCPTAVQAQLNHFVDSLQSILTDNLVAVYLHGSLALGCFNPAASDLDLLVVLHSGMAVETKRDLAQLLLTTSRAPRPLEISFLTQAQLHPWRFPTPFDLHYGEEWRTRYQSALENGAWQEWNAHTASDPDLAGHITVTRARGVTLYGATIRETLPDVPRADYLSSCLGDLADARNEDALARNPVYALLNHCRTYGFLVDGQIRSKDEGGVWALDHVPADLRTIIVNALELYRGNTTASLAAMDVKAMIDYLAQAIAMHR